MSVRDCLKPVESSMFSSAGYDDASWSLIVTYKSTGETRAYLNVSPELAEEVLAAKSVGAAFNVKIRGKFQHEILGADPATAAPPAPKPETQSGISDDDIRGTFAPEYEGDAQPTAEYSVDEGKSWAPAATPAQQKESKPGPEPVPDIDPVAAIALPQTKGPEIDSIVEQGAKLAADAKALVVHDAISYGVAAETVKILQSARDRAFDFLDPIRAAIYKAYQVAQQKQKQALDPIDEAITIVKRGMWKWTDGEEKARLARIADANRIADEQARQQQKEDSEQLTLAEVNDALEAGNTELAEQIMANPIEAPLPYVPPAHVDTSVPQIAGVSTRKNWKAVSDNFDINAFLSGVKNGTLPIERAAKLISPNWPALNKLAKALESAFDIPGFHARDEGVISTRRK